MERLKQYAAAGWDWLRTRQKLTLLAGGVIGAVVDDPLIGLVGIVL